jgi:lipoprotein-anchoring transpeptidase ErfK/SrfK
VLGTLGAVRRRIPTPALLALLAVVAVVGACGRAERPTLGAPVPSTTTTTAFPVRLVAEVRPEIKSIGVYPGAEAPSPKVQLSNPTQYDIVRVFLVAQQQGDWLEVHLPVRPNGSKGWIKSSDVVLKHNQWRMKVELAAHKLTVWNGAEVVHTETVGVGKTSAPTPPGFFYVTEGLTVPSFQRSAYGPFAFGISAHSEVYTTFAGGDGQVGIHGTGSPSSLGKDSSNGCVRMSNEAITKLIKLVPLGTPVEIV